MQTLPEQRFPTFETNNESDPLTMKFLFIPLLLFCAFSSLGQQSLIPLHSFYKDQIFANKLSNPYNEGSFFPASEGEYDLIPAINDSSKQYYDITEVIFKKYLFEIKGDDYYLKISPAIDFSYSKDLNDTIDRKLFQNTRGIHVEGNLFTNFAFSTSLYENQGRYAYYESEYYSSVGELYPKPDSTYLTQNAVIPGAARTKPFKGDGFDYAMAIGYFVYSPFKWLRISAGNNNSFIGDGHRSLLLSDNSVGAPHYRINWKISPKFNFIYFRSRHMNLIRKPSSGSVESYYEAKGFSVNYLTFKPTKNIAISLFEGGMWNRGDSITSTNTHPLYYNPVPFVSGLILKGKNELVSLLGLNLSYQIVDKHRVYGQVAINDYDADKVAFQLGYRGYNYFGLKDFMVQIEYNNVPKGVYEAANRRLNYVHYNLPTAHVKGNGFQEFILRTNYEYNRMYANYTLVYYLTQDYSQTSLIPVYRDQLLSSNSILYSSLEVGYRFNRKMNLMLFGVWTYRTIDNPAMLTANTVGVGLRTGFINHYKDF